MTTFTRRSAISFAAVAAVGAAGAARADEVIDARHAMEEAAITVDRVREEMKSGSPLDDQLKRAKGVLIIPSYYKASFIIGGSYGDGVLLARLPEGGFSDPAFYRMSAASLGLQIGGQSASVIFVILTEKGLDAILKDEFKLGANVGMSVFSVGVGAEAATTTSVGQDIVAYWKSAGLYAGGSFEGALIKPRKDWNAGVYGVDDANPAAIIQRDKLRSATNLKDSLGKSIYPAVPKEN